MGSGSGGALQGTPTSAVTGAPAPPPGKIDPAAAAQVNNQIASANAATTGAGQSPFDPQSAAPPVSQMYAGGPKPVGGPAPMQQNIVQPGQFAAQTAPAGVQPAAVARGPATPGGLNRRVRANGTYDAPGSPVANINPLLGMLGR